MERRSNDSFETFLRQNAEEFKIFPSASTWNNIAKHINNRKTFPFSFIILTISALFSALVVSNPDIPVSDSEPVSPVVSTAKQPSANSAEKTDRLSGISLPKSTGTASLLMSRTLQTGQPEKSGNQPYQPESQSLLPDKPHIHPIKPHLAIVSGYPGVLHHRPSFHSQKVSDQHRDSKYQDSVIEASVSRIAGRKKRKLSTMFFVTPTISYRKLSENKSYMDPTSLPTTFLNYTRYNNINSAVTHKPDIGVEFGFATKYAVSKNLKLRGGLQFNINRYDIKAFTSYYEVATIALNNGYSIDSVNAISKYRNFNGYKADWLENFYLQISAPVGLEVKIKGSEKAYLGIAGTVQPTYILGDRAYLITNDYKNYAKVPWLTRQWNVNTSMETFVSFTQKNVRWQVGPQVRYQLLSSFMDKYPVKENLFDFGLKVGVSLNQQ